MGTRKQSLDFNEPFSKGQDEVGRLYKKISHKTRRENLDSEKRNINSVIQKKSGEKKKDV